MSAFDLLMTAGSTPAESSQSSDAATNKLEKRFNELSSRHDKALAGAKGTACWWKYFEVFCKRDGVTEESQFGNALVDTILVPGPDA